MIIQCQKCNKELKSILDRCLCIRKKAKWNKKVGSNRGVLR